MDREFFIKYLAKEMLYFELTSWGLSESTSKCVDELHTSVRSALQLEKPFLVTSCGVKIKIHFSNPQAIQRLIQNFSGKLSMNIFLRVQTQLPHLQRRLIYMNNLTLARNHSTLRIYQKKLKPYCLHWIRFWSQIADFAFIYSSPSVLAIPPPVSRLGTRPIIEAVHKLSTGYSVNHTLTCWNCKSPGQFNRECPEAGKVHFHCCGSPDVTVKNCPNFRTAVEGETLDRVISTMDPSTPTFSQTLLSDFIFAYAQVQERPYSEIDVPGFLLLGLLDSGHPRTIGGKPWLQILLGPGLKLAKEQTKLHGCQWSIWCWYRPCPNACHPCR